ncbi:MAG: hypothetical protein DRI44_01440 [Chlamydiae bacterium]|nr:MAG: hypothetical protein DRI44_01440 [Chlamydiota bacterium]
MKKNIICFALLLILPAICSASEIINPFPRQIVEQTQVKEFNFNKNTEGWNNVINCDVKAKNGNLIITSSHDDPQVYLKNISFNGPIIISLKTKSKSRGTLQFFWTTPASPNPTSDKSATVISIPDGKWHEYSVEIPVKSKITMLRLDPYGAEGEMEIDWIKINEIKYHPLEIVQVLQSKDFVEAVVTNHSNEKIAFISGDKKFTINPAEGLKINQKINKNSPFEAFTFNLKPAGKTKFPSLVRPVNNINWSAGTNWLNFNSGNLNLKVTPDGIGAMIYYKKNLCAAIFPIAKIGNKILNFKIVALSSNKIKLISKNVKNFTIELKNNYIKYNLEADENIEGPIVRIKDSIEQALLPGIEYLGKNEKSSTDLDLKIPAHIRYKPDKMWVTMPLMAFVTPKSSVAMKWQNMNLQPYFAVPDFFNGADGGMMALEGKKIKVLIKISNGWNNGKTLENIIEWSVKSSGLPKLPTPPRSNKKEIELCLKGIDSVHNENGWGHCADDHFQKRFHADYVSLIWRATGKIEKTPDLIPGGGHLPSPESFFITGRADKWLKIRINQAKEMIKSQRPDGSFHYDGKFQEGHFEDTASGYCAIPAESLLRTAYYTGDEKALTAGLKTLDYISRFRTPRGSQTWEIPLHTPDILASARITKSYILGYKLTGDKKYLKAARKWALTGIPFVYLWGNQPIMKYATIAVLGATSWIAPNWIGLPVQWCGLVYADAILDLAEYDKTFDWKKLAKGIFLCGEQMQYTSGKTIGTLPDSFTLKMQTRNIYDIGPLMLIQFQRRFAGKQCGIYVARSGKKIITAPFPVKIKNGKAIIKAEKGLNYQVIINQKIRNIKSMGSDSIKL